MRLVYLSPVPWNSFAQRPHKFVEWFHSQYDASILWIDPYPTRLPCWRDFLYLGQHLSTNKLKSKSSWVTVFKPFALPIEPLQNIRFFNYFFWKPLLIKIQAFLNHEQSLLVIGKPSALALELLKNEGNCRSIYDAMDDFSSFYSGISRNALAQSEFMIVQKVSTVWASSSALEAKWSNFHSKVQLVPNGLDTFMAHQQSPQKAFRQNRVFGYVGTIATWFDWDWICALAKNRPSDEIRLIGPLHQSASFELPENVHLIPACDHSTAIKHMAQFDVGLIPFKKNSLTESVDPIKYYEYRAFDLPVISSDFGEMSLRRFDPGIFITQKLEDLDFKVAQALKYQRDLSRGRSFADLNSWNSRFETAFSSD